MFSSVVGYPPPENKLVSRLPYGSIAEPACNVRETQVGPCVGKILRRRLRNPSVFAWGKSPWGSEWELAGLVRR